MCLWLRANINDKNQRVTAERIYQELIDARLEVLLDDRKERPGAKFKDADLIGIPFRITVGNKLKDNQVELLTLKTKQMKLIAVNDIVKEAIALITNH